MILLTDITYIKRTDGFTYLSAIMDAYTKEILGFASSCNLEVDFVLDSVKMLMQNHGSQLKENAKLHSDRGSHYTSYAFIDLLKDNDLTRSMSRKANCWDNAPQESFFGHMKDVVKISPKDTHDDVAAKVADWIDYYNNERYQKGLGMLTPAEYYTFTTTGKMPQSN